MSNQLPGIFVEHAGYSSFDNEYKVAVFGYSRWERIENEPLYKCVDVSMVTTNIYHIGHRIHKGAHKKILCENLPGRRTRLWQAGDNYVPPMC